MSSHTVSLEKSAYERLKAARRPGESFSVTVNRLLEGTRPTFRTLAGFMTAKEGRALRETIARMRALETPSEEKHLRAWVGDRGRNARH